MTASTSAIILVAIVCAVVGSMIFQSKNRSPATGAIIGLLFGPFGVLFLAFHSKRPEGDPPAPGQIG